MNMTTRTIFEFLKKHFFTDKKIDFDDAFLFLRLISYDLWYNKYLIIPKLLLLWYQSACYLMCLLYLYHFGDELSSANLANYSTALVAICHALVTITLSFVYYNVYKKNFDELQDIRWSGREGPRLKESQRKTNQRYKKLILSAISAQLYVLYDTSPFSNSRTLDELYLTTKLFHEYFYGPVGSTLYAMHWLLAPILIYSLVVESIIILYYSEHIRTQFDLLCKTIERLYVDKDNVSECHLRHSVEYQKKIYWKLCFCADRYLVLKRFLKLSLQVRLLVLTTVYAILGLVVSVCVLFFLLNEIFDPPIIKVWLYLVSIGVGTGLTLYMFWRAGQTILDSSGRVFHVLTLCPWHIWSPANRRVLATFLLNTEKAEGISIGGVYTFNYNLFIRFFRSAYSIAMILFRLRITNV